MDNPELIRCDDDATPENIGAAAGAAPVAVDGSEEGTSTGAKRKRPNVPKVQGKVPAGQCWWGRVDSYFIEKMELYGRHLTGPRWKE